MAFTMDFHIHTLYSDDAFTSPEDVVKYALKRGLGGIAITDHNTVYGAQRIIEIGNPYLLIVPGIEIEFGNCHIIALNVIEKPQKTYSIIETIEEIHHLGGIAVLAHPYRFFSRSGRTDDITKLVDAVEVANSSTLLFKLQSKKATELSKKYNKGITAGSDSHIPKTIGDAYLSLPEKPKDIDDLLSMVLRRVGEACGKMTSLKNRLIKLQRTTIKGVIRSQN